MVAELFSLKDHTAIVTGAASDDGRAIAVAQVGAKVAITANLQVAE